MKQYIVIILFILLQSASNAQKNISTETDCTDAMAQNAKGRWMKNPVFDRGSTTSSETNKRIDEFHNLFFKIYPEPTGVDVSWHRSTGVSYFGAKKKYRNIGDGQSDFDYLNLPHFLQFYYQAGLFAYHCDAYEKNVLHPGYPGETGTWFLIMANASMGSSAADDHWTINGSDVIMKRPALKTSPGYEILYSEPGSSNCKAFVYRKGVLPYIPVTRKQYLDYCIIYHTNLWDKVIKNYEQLPVRSAEEQEKEKKAKLAKFEKDFGKDPRRLQSAVDYYLSGYKTDQQIKDEQVANAKKIKAEELKKFTDELEKTTTEGLLDSPAMVRVKYYSSPVFETDPAYGLMLITENPDYIRTELPKYIPQFFEVSWKWNSWVPQEKFAKIVEQNFHFETLQAMIDK